MKPLILLLAVVAAGCVNTRPGPAPVSSAPAGRGLQIDSSTMPLTLGSATLTIDSLQRSNGVYAGNYHIKVFPYFLKNDRGRIAMVVSDESLAEVDRGNVTKLTGTASSAKAGVPPLQIDAVATPAGADDGKLKIQFQVGSRKMVFEPAYHFMENPATLALNGKTNGNPASSRSPHDSLNP